MAAQAESKYSHSFVRKMPKDKQGRARWQLVAKHKDDSGKWHQQTKVHHGNKSSANKALQEWCSELESKDADPSFGSMQVPEYVSYYIKSRVGGSEGITPSTQRNYEFTAKHLNRKELQVPLKDLSVRDVEAWRQATDKEGIGSSIRARAFSLLKYAISYAIKNGHREAPNPVLAVKSPVSKRRGANPLSEESIKELNTLLEKKRTKGDTQRDFVDAVHLAILTGMRQGELCALRWQDVDGWRTGKFESGSAIHVRHNLAVGGKGVGYYLKEPKNGKTRDFPANDDICNLLRARWELMRNVAGDVTATMYVLGKPDGTPYSPNFLGKQWRAFIDMTDLTGENGLVPHFHDLRHTAAVHMLRVPIAPITVAGILGHDVATLLRYYARFLDADAYTAMQEMDGRMLKKMEQADVLQLPKTGTDQ